MKNNFQLCLSTIYHAILRIAVPKKWSTLKVKITDLDCVNNA